LLAENLSHLHLWLLLTDDCKWYEVAIYRCGEKVLKGLVLLKNSEIAVPNIFAIGAKYRKSPPNLFAPTHKRFSDPPHNIIIQMG